MWFYTELNIFLVISWRLVHLTCVHGCLTSKLPISPRVTVFLYHMVCSKSAVREKWPPGTNQGIAGTIDPRIYEILPKWLTCTIYPSLQCIRSERRRSDKSSPRNLFPARESNQRCLGIQVGDIWPSWTSCFSDVMLTINFILIIWH